MKKLAIPVFAFLMAMMLVGTASAQSTAPTIGDGDVQIVCDNDYYFPDVFGNVEIYCNITNVGGSSKNHKVGATFDDYLNEEVELVDVQVHNGTGWSSIKPNMNKNKPEAKKTRQLSQQNIQTMAGQTTQLLLQIRVPFASSGKFDVHYGETEYLLDPWWNVTWQYKACYNLSGHTQNLTGDMVDMPYGYPFNMTMNTQNLISGSKMQADCDDVRVLFNDTDYVHFFMRDCGASVSEIWGVWNFTVGETYEMCVYYGNAGAANNETNPTDIVFEWQDFNDASAFNWSEWSTRRAGSGSSVDHGSVNGTINSFGIHNGYLLIRQGTGVIGNRNTGSWIWRNDTTYNISKTGLLSESNFKYTEYLSGDYSQHAFAFSPRNPDLSKICWDTTNYAVTGCNGTKILHEFMTTADYQMYAYFTTPWSLTEGRQNTSNLYTTRNFWERSGWKIIPNSSGEYNIAVYGEYGGQPWSDPVIMNQVFGTRSYGYFVYDDFASHLGLDTVLEIGSAKGGGATGMEYAWYDYWFSRPFLEGEPFATGGVEIPLNNATLVVNFTSPTPANATYGINTSHVMINVTANKTIEWCKLDWNGANYTMDTDTDYCYLDKLMSGNHTYKVWVEDYWGYEEATEERVLSQVASTAMLGVKFDVLDFNFSSDTYVTGANVTFNTSLPQTNLVVMTSMNVKKESGLGGNDVWARVRVNGTVLAEERIRTVDTVGEEGSTGISPFSFSLPAGDYQYIELQFKRTGNGTISVNDIDMSMGQLNTQLGGSVQGALANGNFSYTANDYATAHNFTMSVLQNTSVFIATKITVSSDNFTKVSYAFQNLDNASQISPYGGRYLSGAADVGSMAGVFTDYFPVGNVNMTILAKNYETGRTTDVNYTTLYFELTDNFTKTIDSFQVSNPNTNDTDSINVSDSWTLLANYTKEVVSGDSYLIGMYATYESPIGAQTVTHKINATGASCTTKKERYLSNGNDVGNTFMYFICDNLTVGQSYDFQLWAQAESGMWFDQYDEAFTGFEVQSFDVSTGNLPPIPAGVTNPLNGSRVIEGSVNITWNGFIDQNSNFDDYNISILNADGSFNSTVVGSTTDLYVVYSTENLTDTGTWYRVQVEGCDTASLCAASESWFLFVQVPTYTEFSSDPETTDFTNVSDLTNVSAPVIANTYAKVEWSGSGYDVLAKDLDSAMEFADNLVSVNTTDIPTFDNPATITLKTVGYGSNFDYNILKNGILCGDCGKISSNPVQFTVTGFSNYTTIGVGGIASTLSEAGTGLGGFLTAIENPLIGIILALGIIGGILAVFYGIATVIRRAMGGVVAGSFD